MLHDSLLHATALALGGLLVALSRSFHAEWRAKREIEAAFRDLHRG